MDIYGYFSSCDQFPVFAGTVSERGPKFVEKPTTSCFSEGLHKQPDLMIRDTILKYRENDNTKENSLVDMEYTQTCSKQKHIQIIRDTVWLTCIHLLCQVHQISNFPGRRSLCSLGGNMDSCPAYLRGRRNKQGYPVTLSPPPTPSRRTERDGKHL